MLQIEQLESRELPTVYLLQVYNLQIEEGKGKHIHEVDVEVMGYQQGHNLYVFLGDLALIQTPHKAVVLPTGTPIGPVHPDVVTARLGVGTVFGGLPPVYGPNFVIVPNHFQHLARI